MSRGRGLKRWNVMLDHKVSVLLAAMKMPWWLVRAGSMLLSRYEHHGRRDDTNPMLALRSA